MKNVNDEKIILLKKQIEDKRGKLNSIKKFSPVTNCSIELDGTRLNINVLDRTQLTMLLVKLNAYMHSAKDLGLLELFSISGFSVQEWIDDVQAKLDIISKKDEEAKLKAMEDKLTRLLSNEKKVELEIGEIEEMLK